jgi:hypothetical protein
MGSIANEASVEGSFDNLVEGPVVAALEGAVDTAIATRIKGKRLHDEK